MDTTLLSYKGFLGSVNFSVEDNVLYGKIEGIDVLVNYEGESVAELVEAFHQAVDDYLAYCQEQGIEPHKTYSGRLNIRISPEVHRRIAAIALKTGTTINGFIKKSLEKDVMNYPAS